MRRSQGFTLIELMIVVAVIVVLSVIGMNAYRKYTARARVTEVYAMFAEIRAKEESYRAEYSQYLNVSSGETDFYPVLGSNGTEPASKAWNPTNAAWNSLGVRPPTGNLFCGYVVVSGTPGTWNTAGTYVRSAFNNQVPQVTWWAAVAMCDNDGVNGTLYSNTNATFGTSSVSTIVRSANETN